VKGSKFDHLNSVNKCLLEQNSNLVSQFGPEIEKVDADFDSQNMSRFGKRVSLLSFILYFGVILAVNFFFF
jgi:hypothetical protein